MSKTKEAVQHAVIVDPQEFGLEPAKVNKIAESFMPKLSERDGYMKVYNDVIQKELGPDTYREAEDLRKKLVKVRTGIAEIHKVEKAYHLAAGRYVDAIKNKITLPIEQMEEKLRDIAEHEVRIKREAEERLKAHRLTLLSEVTTNPTMYPVLEMNEEAFNDLLEGLKLMKEQRLAREREEAAEKKRIAAEQEAEQKRIREENIRLRKEAEEAERLRQEEMQKRIEEAERAVAENQRLQREIQAKEKAEADRLLAEAEQSAKQQAAEQRKAQAPDKVKITNWIDAIRSIPEPRCTTENGIAATDKLAILLGKFEMYAKQEIEKL